MSTRSTSPILAARSFGLYPASTTAASTAQRLHRQRLENLGILACGASHELKNLLSPMILGAELAALDLPPGHPACVSLTTVISVAKRARDLVQRFTTYGTLRERDIRPICLAQIVAEVGALLQPTLPARAQLSCDVVVDLPPILADRIYAHQVITNLVINAADALKPDTGLIELRLASVEIAEPRCDDPLSPAPGRYVRLSVQDNGVGIDDTARRHIFKEFFTTKALGHGTGLGLAIVQQIMGEIGGGLTLESKPGHGSTFHTYWPVATTPAPSSASSPS